MAAIDADAPAAQAKAGRDRIDRPLRSLLFVPSSEPRKVRRAGDFDADVIVLDLEDAVADNEKESARRYLHENLGDLQVGRSLLAVRVNGVHTGLTEDDIRAVVRAPAACLVIPKVESRESLFEISDLIAEVEAEQGMDVGSLHLFPLLETAVGLSRCEEILAGAPERVVCPIFGSGDFTVDLGISFTEDGRELLYARSRLVVAARAAGLGMPIDGPFLSIEDATGLERDTRTSKELGFGGRVAVYPGQVLTINRVYGDLNSSDAEFFRHVVDAFERAEAIGSASIRVDGRFVDYPIYRLAKARLASHQEGNAVPADSLRASAGESTGQP